ncbi:MAG TPA: hypothetical protein DEA43_04740 [Candidatus Moranbacteria bacterium]|nr:hypothetical protein [Candidatus Moranbacteria bacterium]HBT46161.1 hypothetical protein [Candidatus Moranbacteria bacterium]
MKKTALLAFVIISTVFLSGCSDGEQVIKQTNNENVLLQNETTLPTRGAEISGVVSSIEGNEIIIKKEIGAEVLTEEQMAKKKAERQKMSESERQALRASELSNVKTEDTTLTIPVGVPIYKADGTGTGNASKSDLSEIKKGTYLSIWTTASGIEAVKIKGLN